MFRPSVWEGAGPVEAKGFIRGKAGAHQTYVRLWLLIPRLLYPDALRARGSFAQQFMFTLLHKLSAHEQKNPRVEPGGL